MIAPHEVYDAYENLNTKRKMALILKSKSIAEISVKVGDAVEVCQRNLEKRGKWSLPKIVTAVDHDARTMRVPGKGKKDLSFAVEDIRLPSFTIEFSRMVLEALDELGTQIDESIKNINEAEVADNGDAEESASQQI